MKQTNIVAYPFIFRPEEKSGYFIECPDLQGAYTGINENDIAYGIAMAEEVLGMTLATCIELGEEIPQPSKIEKITLAEGEFVNYIKVDVNDYLREQELVRKNVTIPKWVNEYGVRNHINFSQLLTSTVSSLALHGESRVSQ